MRFGLHSIKNLRAFVHRQSLFSDIWSLFRPAFSMKPSDAPSSTDQLDPHVNDSMNALTDSVNQLKVADEVISDCLQAESCRDYKCPHLHPRGMFLLNPGCNPVEQFLSHNSNQRAHHHGIKCTGINKTKLSKYLDKQRTKEANGLVASIIPQPGNPEYEFYQCDYCHCSCHPFMLCSAFRNDKNQSNQSGSSDGKSSVRLIGQRSYSEVIPFFTSAFLAFYCVDERLPQTGPSQFIPSINQVSWMLIQEQREMTSDLFKSQRGHTFLATNFVGGKRDLWSETAVKCATRELEEEVGYLFEQARVSIAEIKRIVMYQWETDKLITHIDRHGSQITFFIPLPIAIMNRLEIAMPQFYRFEPIIRSVDPLHDQSISQPIGQPDHRSINQPVDHISQAAVLWPEWEISRQLETIKSLRQQLYDSRQPKSTDPSQPVESVRITFPANSSLTEEIVQAIFSTKFGPVHNVRMRERDAFINFARNGPLANYAALAAINTGSIDINGVPCTIMASVNKNQNTPSRSKKGSAVRDAVMKRVDGKSSSKTVMFSDGDLFPFAAEVLIDLHRYCQQQNKSISR